MWIGVATATFMAVHDTITTGVARDPIVWSVVEQMYVDANATPPDWANFATSRTTLALQITHGAVPAAVGQCRTFVQSAYVFDLAAVAKQCIDETYPAKAIGTNHSCGTLDRLLVDSTSESDPPTRRVRALLEAAHRFRLATEAGDSLNEAVALACWGGSDELDELVTIGKEINNKLLAMRKDASDEIDTFIRWYTAVS
jgi:hypothetical protein